MKAQLFPAISGIRGFVAARRRAGQTIGLVPTMGALHRGHGSLIDMARRECGVVVVSIFVNPIQFNQASDYDRYPRNLDTDLRFCEERGADCVFAPSAEEMYPAPLDTHVDVDRLTEGLCGAHRPGHFRGVATVVAKLFLIILPDKAYFGEKDAQQLAVIERMVRDLNIPVEIVPAPTVREEDGLALSSRNKHLSGHERRIAAVLYQGLQSAAKAVAAGERDPAQVAGTARNVITSQPEVRVEYLEVVDPAEMRPVDTIEAPVRIAVAAWVGETRLIDNVLCKP